MYFSSKVKKKHDWKSVAHCETRNEGRKKRVAHCLKHTKKQRKGRIGKRVQQQ